MAQHTATDYFKRTIQHYLECRAQEDELFRPRYENPKKNIDECCDYILDCVYESGRNGFADDEIYALALHYYDEDDIKVGKHRECRVIVNHTIELTEEEKAEARREAMRRATQEAYAQLTKHPQAKKAASDKSTSTPYADLKSLSLRMLTDMGEMTPAELLSVMRTEPCATTRMEALKLLGRFGDEESFEAGVLLGLNDRYELLRRNAATYAWQLGRPALLPALVEALVNNDESQRVCYIAQKGLQLAPREAVDSVLREVVAASTVEGRDSIRTLLQEMLDRSFRMKERDLKQLYDGKTLAARISAARSMRNNTYHEYVPELLQFVATPSEPLELRVNVAECLGWFVHTPRRAEIIDTCRLAARTAEASLKDELLQTALRLESTVSVPNTTKQYK